MRALSTCNVIIVLDHTSSLPTTYENEACSNLNKDEEKPYIQVRSVLYHLGSSPSTTGPINARVLAYKHKSSTEHPKRQVYSAWQARHRIASPRKADLQRSAKGFKDFATPNQETRFQGHDIHYHAESPSWHLVASLGRYGTDEYGGCSEILMSS